MARITVIGGTGLIGRKVAARLREAGHEVRAASPSTGVDLLTGAGLDDALAGSSVVIDVSKPRTYAPDAVWRHFDLAARTLAGAETRARVIHHVALSAVGTERVPQPIPFYRAKAHGEAILRSSGVPFSIVRATQFFEFGAQIGAQAGGEGTDATRVADTQVQPIAGDDVAAVLAGLGGGARRDAARRFRRALSRGDRRRPRRHRRPAHPLLRCAHRSPGAAPRQRGLDRADTLERLARRTARVTLRSPHRHPTPRGGRDGSSRR